MESRLKVQLVTPGHPVIVKPVCKDHPRHQKTGLKQQVYYSPSNKYKESGLKFQLVTPGTPLTVKLYV